MAGSDAPISIVGGSRQTRGDEAAQQHARHAVLRAGDVDAIDQRDAHQHQHAETRDAHFQRGVDAQRMLFGAARRRGRPRLPRHRPPMKVASRKPSETAVEPMASCSS